MIVKRRHRAVTAGLAALSALCGCGIELRAITVDDGGLTDTAPIDRADGEGDVSDDVPIIDSAVDIDPPSDVAEADATDAASAEASTPDVPVGPDVTTDVAPGCAPPRTMCGTSCVTLTSDAGHCGGCGIRCASDETCTAGTCLAGGTVTSRAGATCMRPSDRGNADPLCGSELLCFTTGSYPMCTIGCMHSPSQATERAMCGGVGSTCVAYGDPPDDDSECARACAPGAAPGAPGACRAGFVCTGWWFTHFDGRADTPGCQAFCSTDGDCPSGARCNPRMGWCGARPVNVMRLPDGSPCDPTVTELVMEEGTRRNTQCRGMCLGGGDPMFPTRGICASYVNLAVTTTCPDDPSVVEAYTDEGSDNLGLCVERRCSANRDCRAPFVCRYPEDFSGRPLRTEDTTCAYPTMAQPTGIP